MSNTDMGSPETTKRLLSEIESGKRTYRPLDASERADAQEAIRVLTLLKSADEQKRSRSDIPVVSVRINWSYLIDAVREMDFGNSNE